MSEAKTFLGVVNSLSERFGKKGRRPEAKEPGVTRLADLSSDDLASERVRVEQEEKKLLQRVRQIEAEKRAVFEQATKESSVHKQRMMARKIKELDRKTRTVERNLRVVSQQLRIINGFIQLKARKRLWQHSGLWSKISQMDLSHLEAYVTDAMIEGRFNADRFGNMIATLEGTERFVEDVEEDADVLAILAEIHAAALERPGGGDREVTCRDVAEAYAVAKLEGDGEDSLLVVNDEYTLVAGVQSRVPEGFTAQRIELSELIVEIDVAILAGGMEILPYWKQTLRFGAGQDSDLVKFRLIPRHMGQKRILIEFYHEGNWLTKIDFEVEVVEAQLQQLSQMSAELLISVPETEQAQILASLKETETLAGMTEEQILERAAENSPEVTRAFLEKLRTLLAEQRTEMYQCILADREMAGEQLAKALGKAT